MKGPNPFKVLLCIPPTYDRLYPPLGTPAITAFLKSKGIDTQQLDLNINFFEYIEKNKLNFFLTNKYKQNRIKNRIYYWRDLNYKGQDNFSYPFESVPGAAFDFTEKLLSSKQLFRYIDDLKENIFHKFFRDEIFEKIRKERFDMIGFSITAPSQVISSFTFGHIIKNELPHISVVIGGQWISFFKEELLKRKDFGRFYDYIIYFEGETALYSLINSIRKHKSLLNVPNLIYKNGNKFNATKTVVEEDMNKLPCPDFDGLPLEKYFKAIGEKSCVLTFETSRGCYWNKCIFCVDLPTPRPRYRQKDIKLLIEDIKTLKRKYKVKLLIISGAVFSPWQMKEFSQELIKQKIKINWWAWTRFERYFTKELLALTKKAGCVTMLFGLESINQRLLDLCEKGTKVDIIKRIIKDATDLKLNIYTQVMIGLPTETIQEALDTLIFLRDNPGYFRRTPVFNTYYLVPKNPVFNNPKRYGIEFKKDSKLPFKYFYPFRQTIGEIDNNIAQKLMMIFDFLRKKQQTLINSP